MKTLTLAPDQFSLAYVTLLHDALVLDAKERRAHSKLLDRLDAISAEAEHVGRAIAEEVSVIVEDVEHAVILKAVQVMPWKAALSRIACALEDHIAGAPSA